MVADARFSDRPQGIQTRSYLGIIPARNLRHVCFSGAERRASGAADSRSEARAEAIGGRLPGRAGGYPPGIPTDPYVRHARIRFLRQSGCSPRAVPWRAGVRVGALKVSPLSPASGCAARRRLPSRGSLGPPFPTFAGTLRRDDCPLSLSGASLGARLPDPLPASRVRGVPYGLVTWSKHPVHTRACGHPVPHSGSVVKETGGAPTFPRSPCEDLPRSPTPVVSSTLAIPHPGLLPSGACTPSAFLSVPP
jgi:hypothetical protein